MSIKHASEFDVPFHCIDRILEVFWYWFWWIESVYRGKTLQVSPKRVHLA